MDRSHPLSLRRQAALLEIHRANQVWPIDISYVPMKQGYMYLTAIIDLYSRYIVGWQISNSLEKETQTELLMVTAEWYRQQQSMNRELILLCLQDLFKMKRVTNV